MCEQGSGCGVEVWPVVVLRQIAQVSVGDEGVSQLVRCAMSKSGPG